MNIIPPVIVYTVDHIALFPNNFLKRIHSLKQCNCVKNFIFI